MWQFFPIRHLTLQEIKNAAEVAAELKKLASMIKQGWPETKAQVPLKVQDYFPFYLFLSIQNAVHDW